jgi:Flp pilus assembly protein TadG
MWRMTRRRREERGAIAIWVALSIVPILAFVAIVADVGLMYWERGQLQNGADAAAMAVAQECAANPSTCMGVANGIASDYASVNANDDSAAIEAIEFSDVTASSGKVRVTTSTLTEAGATALKHPFASLIVPHASTVQAAAKAEWGAPIAGSTFPLTIAECEFADLAPQDADTVNPVVSELLINDSNTGEPCADGSPGGFGWLDAVDCAATVSAGGTVGGAPGIQPTESKTGCDEDDFNAILCTTQLVPLYSATTAQGQNATYTISRFAAFVITAFKTGGARSAVYCDQYPVTPFTAGGNAKGIQGFFVKYVELGEDFDLGNVPGAGLTIVRFLPDPA